jgi:hypothetical protein
MSFNVVHQTHAVFLEEAGRANDAEIAGYFSHYWHAQLRMFIGSINQLPPKKKEWEDYMMEIQNFSVRQQPRQSFPETTSSVASPPSASHWLQHVRAQADIVLQEQASVGPLGSGK